MTVGPGGPPAGKARRGGWILLAFTLSGVAGLAYEVVWSRYLGLYVGHGAYAQVLVLAVYLGGMAVGALAVGDRSRTLARPLAAYALAEVVLGVLGAIFHPAFLGLSSLSYDTLFPAIGSGPAVGAVRWGLAGLLVLPSSIVLGMTFPLMAAGLVRRAPERPGRGVADAYLANTLGGAAGVLLTGFLLVPRIGLPGSVLTAAALNLAAAGLVLWAARGEGVVAATESDGTRAGTMEPAGAEVAAGAPARTPAADSTLWRLLLAVSFGTALASFAYEIGWIRLLSLALGSATHSFELMLSAFILGLAIGARLIRGTTDRARHPVRVLAWVQWTMGLAAVATLPLYGWAFETVAGLVTALPGREAGYATFNLARYGLALAMMLPATVLAGTTLPLITAALLRARSGERAIGWVYGMNTLGSVAGACLAGLVALPVLGLRGLLVAGATLDMALGVVLLAVVAHRRGGRPVLVGAMGLATVAVALGTLRLVSLDPLVLSSGVFRYGSLPPEGTRRILYHHDGRTATVSAYVRVRDGIVVLATNGKPDASLDPRWFNPRRDTVPVTPIPEGQDAPVQIFGPLLGQAFRPGARTAVNIGHGSGVSGHSMLSSPVLERMVTVEIEPAMVEGSLTFLPANERVFEDPRATFVFDDAKSYLAYRNERFDLVFSEPSNPWVSGVSGLFTREFYERVRAYLAPGGILAQWIHLYEMQDDLVLSVVAALDASFASYRAYQVGDADMIIVASADGALPAPDWSVFDWPGVREMLVDVPAVRPQHLESLLLFDETTLRPILDAGVPANSDFHPILEAGAERARFEAASAEGFISLGNSRIDLRRALARERAVPPDSFAPVPARGLPPVVRRGLSTWLHHALRAGGGLAPAGFPEWQTALVDLRDYLGDLRDGRPPPDWRSWVERFERVERDLHSGTAGWVDPVFYPATLRFLEAAYAPPEARAAVALLHGTATWRFEEAAEAADVLLPPALAGEPWVEATVLLDAAVISYLETDRVESARRALDELLPRTGRQPWNLRNRLLEALVREAEAGRTGSPARSQGAAASSLPQ